jgi:hypothetical protein
MNIKTQTISYRKVMILLICSFVVILFSYTILMNAIVSTGKQLTRIEDSVMEIQSKIMNTEKEMVIMRKSISKDEALINGFVEPTQIAYIKIDSIKTAFLNE